MHDLKIVQNYTIALFKNATLESKQKIIFDQIHLLNQVIESSGNIKSIVLSPITAKSVKIKIMRKIAELAGFDPYVQKFLEILIKNGRLSLLDLIAENYLKMLKNYQGIKSAEIISAAPLDKKEIEFIKNILESELNKTIEIKVAEDKSLLGGMIIKYESNLMDCSIKGALGKIEKIAKSAKI